MRIAMCRQATTLGLTHNDGAPVQTTSRAGRHARGLSLGSRVRPAQTEAIAVGSAVNVITRIGQFSISMPASLGCLITPTGDARR